MTFAYPITLSTQLVLPCIFLGTLLIGTLVTLYLYARTHEKVYLATVIFQLFAGIFIASEVFIIVFGSMHYNQSISVQFHRSQQLAGTSFLFVIPYLLRSISPSTFPRFTRALQHTGVILFSFIVGMALFVPESFVSLTTFKAIASVKEAEFGRGQEGILYMIRDLYLFFIIGFTLNFIPHIYRDKRSYILSRWLLWGVSMSLCLALLDIINVYTNYKVAIPPVMDFSYASLGLSLFAMSTMLGVFHNFFLNLCNREDSFKMVQHLAKIGGIEWQRDTNKLTLSQEFMHNFDIPKNHKSGTVQAYATNHFIEEDQAAFLDYIERCSNGEPTKQETFRFHSRGDSMMWALFTPPEVLFTTKDGSPSQLLWSVQNVTHQRMIESQLRHSQKMDAVGQLAGGIAHDFNNMLGGIQGAADLLKNTFDEEDIPRQAYVQLVLDTTTRAAELTKHLLNFSRKGIIELKPIDLTNILSDAIAILQRTTHKRIALHTNLDALQPYVMGDATLLQNIFLNIGINAVQAMPGGGTLTINMDNYHFSKEEALESNFDIHEGNHVQISMTDTGVGVAPEYLKKIFEPFFTTKELGEGTGLGLAAVYGIIQEHSGVIHVDSTVGEGTTFTIRIPITEKRPKVINYKQKSKPLAEGTILIVEDEPVVRLTTSTLLEKMGYKVLIAEHGKEGVDMYIKHEKEISLVILDYVMPGMDGHQCFREMKKINPNAHIILTSGYTGDVDISGLKDEGLHAFISKPYGQKELKQILFIEAS